MLRINKSIVTVKKRLDPGLYPGPLNGHCEGRPSLGLGTRMIDS